jgi:hypothetical protein
MLIKIAWDDEAKTIVRYSFEKGWGWNDLNSAFAQAGELFSSVDHEVSVIMDFRDASLIPQNALSHIQRGFKNPKPTNVGLTVIITPTRFLQTMVDAAQKVFGGKKIEWKMQFVNSEEAALSAINASAQQKAEN